MEIEIESNDKDGDWRCVKIFPTIQNQPLERSHSLLLSIYLYYRNLSENIVAIMCSKKPVWGFEEWVIDSLTERANICKALEPAEDSPAGDEGPLKHN